MKLIFMGTPDFAATALAAILDARHQVVAVYSRPPAKAGRGQKPQLSPVQKLAEAHDIPVFTPRNFKAAEEVERFAAHDAALAIVAAYGLILPPAILDAPTHGCWNIHASLLPRWRGAAPIQRAIMAGDAETGITLMQMDAGLDTGAILATASLPIAPADTFASLHDKLATLGSTLTCDIVAAAEKGTLPQAVPQDNARACYAEKIDKAETRIDWHAPAAQIRQKIHALSPFPGAWTETRQGERIKILAAEIATFPSSHDSPAGTVMSNDPIIHCGESGNSEEENSALRLLTLQRAGKSPLPASAFQNGKGLQINEVLG